MGAGFNAFIPKPIDIYQMLNAFKTHLKLEWIMDLKTSFENMQRIQLNEIFPPSPGQLEKLFYLAKRGNLKEIRNQAEQLAQSKKIYCFFFKTYTHG